MFQPCPEAQSLLTQDPTAPYLMAMVLSVRRCTSLRLMDGRKTFSPK